MTSTFTRLQWILCFGILVFPLMTSFAAFFPGETLDPNCGPTDPECHINIAQVRNANPYRFYDLDNSNYIELQAPIDVPVNTLLVFPPNDGDAGQFLTTDGNGILTWGTGNGVLPDQTGHGGKYLQTDGTNTQWMAAMVSHYYNGADVRFYNTGDVFYTGFVAPVGLLANTTYTLPIDYPTTDKILQSDNSGNLTWVDPPGGGMGVFVGQTTTSHTGAFSGGGKSGYLAGNFICDQEFPNSHICTQTELMFSISQIDVTTEPDWTYAAWIASGAAKYSPANVPANDCDGFTHGTPGTYLGTFWIFDQTDGGAGGLGHCGNTIPIACCR